MNTQDRDVTLGRNISLETSAWKMNWRSGKTDLKKMPNKQTYRQKS